MFFNYLKADYLKTRHSVIRGGHIWLPLITALGFIAYYRFSPWSEIIKIDGYFQVLGAGLPFLIGLFCAMVSQQEQSAGNFQNLLLSPVKEVPFFSKLCLLLIFCACFLFLASMSFGIAFVMILKSHVVGLYFYLCISGILFLSSIPMYIWHFYLALRMGGGISVGVGLMESLMSAVLLTGLGDFVWKYIPCTWPGRMSSVFWKAWLGDQNACVEWKGMVMVCMVVVMAGMVVYWFWVHNWEGTETLD